MKLRYDKNREKLIMVESTRTEYHQVKISLTKKVKGYQFTPRYKLGVWNGDISLFDNGEFDVGLWKEIYMLCKLHGWKFEIENKEDFPINKKINIEDVQKFSDKFFKYHTFPDGSDFTPYTHQIDSAYKIMKNRFCLTEVATGGGKSLIFALIAFYILHEVNPNAKFLLLVPNISLVTQFYDDIIDYNNGFKGGGQNPNPLDIKMVEIMSDKPRRDEGIANIVIGTVQSLEKRVNNPDFKGWFEQFNVVATDECLHPDTLITMSDDSKKKIKDVKIGDYVQTYNDEKNIYEVKMVDYIYKNLSKGNKMFEIEMEDGSFIKITGNHKVRLKNGNWKRVDELDNDDDIVEY